MNSNLGTAVAAIGLCGIGVGLLAYHVSPVWPAWVCIGLGVAIAIRRFL